MIAKALLVGDNADIRSVLRRMLECAGDEVLEAADGLETLTRLSETVDRLVTDINMPNMDGVELILKVKKRNPDIAIIAMSGAGLVGGALNTWSAGKIGADEVLEKLFDYAEMIDTAKQLIAQS
tara:strand:- start:204 stop:575 length:372 start_codon:yes stop_codon:yes gene_type:complete